MASSRSHGTSPTEPDTDPVLEWLLRSGKPVTLESYLELAYPEGVNLDAELLSQLPEPIQRLASSAGLKKR